MRIRFIALLLALLPMAAFAQTSPVGTWRTIDDETGKVKSTVEIYETTSGALAGKVLEVFNSEKGPNPLCDKCKGANHNKPIKGMVIVWGMTKGSGQTWEGGKIMDPKSGSVYSAKMTPIENGAKLEVRGFKGISLLGRTQTWVRQQ